MSETREFIKNLKAHIGAAKQERPVAPQPNAPREARVSRYKRFAKIQPHLIGQAFERACNEYRTRVESQPWEVELRDPLERPPARGITKQFPPAESEYMPAQTWEEMEAERKAWAAYRSDVRTRVRWLLESDSEMAALAKQGASDPAIARLDAILEIANRSDSAEWAPFCIQWNEARPDIEHSAKQREPFFSAVHAEALRRANAGAPNVADAAARVWECFKADPELSQHVEGLSQDSARPRYLRWLKHEPRWRAAIVNRRAALEIRADLITAVREIGEL